MMERAAKGEPLARAAWCLLLAIGASASAGCVIEAGDGDDVLLAAYPDEEPTESGRPYGGRDGRFEPCATEVQHGTIGDLSWSVEVPVFCEEETVDRGDPPPEDLDLRGAVRSFPGPAERRVADAHVRSSGAEH
jgi:hypothetical protein